MSLSALNNIGEFGYSTCPATRDSLFQHAGYATLEQFKARTQPYGIIFPHTSQNKLFLKSSSSFLYSTAQSQIHVQEVERHSCKVWRLFDQCCDY
jgi:hypothetical protein